MDAEATNDTEPGPTDIPLAEVADKASVTRPVVAMTIGMWLLNVAMITTSGAIAQFAHQWLRGGLRLGLAVFGIGLCLGIHRLIMLAPARPFRRRIWLTIGLTFCAAFIHWMANEAVLRVSGIVYPATRDGLGLNAIFFGYWAWFFLAWAALHLAIDYSDQVRRQSDEHARIAIAAREAQIRALRYQINPHFLFNTLNSLSTLVLEKRSAESEQMIERLSAFLRTALEDDPADEVTLATEIANQRLYLEIEQARFPELAVEFDIEASVERALVPSFLLQPLVENAIKYGRPSSRRKASLSIKACTRWERLELSVTNDVPETRVAHGTGLGLSNVRERLRLRYGKDFTFAAGPGPGGRFEVRLSLPLKLRLEHGRKG